MATSTIRAITGFLPTERITTTTTLSELTRVTLPSGYKLVIAYMNYSTSAPKQLRLYDTTYGLPISELITNTGTQSSMTVMALTVSTSVALYGSSVSGGGNDCRIFFIKFS